MQIENITALIEQPSQEMEKVKITLRMDVINNTTNLDKRIFKLYDLIENELLGLLVCSSNYISSYKVRSHCKLIADDSPFIRRYFSLTPVLHDFLHAAQDFF